MFDRASTAFEAALPWKSSPDVDQPSLKEQTVVQAGHYEGVASKVDYSGQAAKSPQPSMRADGQSRPVRPLTDADFRWLSLAEAVQMALNNNAMVRVDGDFLSSRSSLLVDPDRSPSIYDVAIVRNGFQIGQKGEEAALSDFAPRLTTSMLWNRDENVQNNLFQSGGLAPGNTLYQEGANFRSRLEKIFGNGASVALTGDIDYSLNNAPARLFGSVNTGTIGAEFRQPLLQGFGSEYTAIAGPIARQSPTVLGANQGVVISRINADISVAQFEAEVRNQIFDVNQVYWDLYLAYQQYETQVAISRSLKKIWDQAAERFKRGLEGGGGADEAQAADNYYASVATQRQSLADIYETEGRLRRLLGLPSSDGKILRPSDVPQTQPLEVDWANQLGEALSNRVELRKQKMAIRSLQLQLKAAGSLVKPRGDFVARYRLNGFGNTLWASSDNETLSTPGNLNSFVHTLFRGDQTGWDLGFEVSVPFGFMAERAQVRQLEWRLAKAMTALSAQELEVQYELRNAIIRLQRWHNDLLVAAKRKEAAARRVKFFSEEYRLGRKPADLLLRSEISNGEAQVAHYRAVVQYNKAIANLAYRTGVILGEHNVRIVEGTPPQLYADAQMLLSTEEQEVGVFERLNVLPVVSNWLSRRGSWEEKSDAAMRQSLPPGYFHSQVPEQHSQVPEQRGPVLEQVPKMTEDPGSVLPPPPLPPLPTDGVEEPPLLRPASNAASGPRWY
jgi:outer membrane protein TolC